MKNKSIMYGVCIAACILGLVDTDYTNLTPLNAAAVIAMAAALLSVIVNIFIGRRRV